MVEFSDGNLYFGSGDGKFQSINSTTGSPIWAFNIGNATNFTTATVQESYVYFGTTTGFIFKLNKVNGSLVNFADASSPVGYLYSLHSHSFRSFRSWLCLPQKYFALLRQDLFCVLPKQIFPSSKSIDAIAPVIF